MIDHLDPIMSYDADPIAAAKTSALECSTQPIRALVDRSPGTLTVSLNISKLLRSRFGHPASQITDKHPRPPSRQSTDRGVERSRRP
jgi:hypothetical protein